MQIYLDIKLTSLTSAYLPLSLAAVAENDQSFYAEFSHLDKGCYLNDWATKYVEPKLRLYSNGIKTREGPLGQQTEVRGTTDFVRQALESWLEALEPHKGRIDVWIDHAFVWAAFCDIWGDMSLMPPNLNQIPAHLPTLMRARGLSIWLDRAHYLYYDNLTTDQKPDPLVEQHIKDNKGDALSDALVIKLCAEKLL